MPVKMCVNTLPLVEGVFLYSASSHFLKHVQNHATNVPSPCSYISSMVRLMMKQVTQVPDVTTLVLPFVGLSLYLLFVTCTLQVFAVLLSNSFHCVYLRGQSGPCHRHKEVYSNQMVLFNFHLNSVLSSRKLPWSAVSRLSDFSSSSVYTFHQDLIDK